ncbi:MAG: SDR family NAD(P)-dependent oxidoreductase [Bacteroidia bacterium]
MIERKETLKTVIITGGNTGLGYACAKNIAEQKSNWFIVLACRNQQKAKEASEKMKKETSNNNIDFLLLDLASIKLVRDFADEFIKKQFPPLQGIICDAGVSLSDAISITVDGIETTFQVNCLSHFLLINLLLSHLRIPARILFVSSELHRNDGPLKSFWPDFKNAQRIAYPEQSLRPIKKSGSQRYSTSKLCLLMYTYELALRLPLNGFEHITVNAYNPGLMPDTGLGGLNKKLLRKLFLKYIIPLFAKGAVSNPKNSGKILADLLISPNYENVTGKYFDRAKRINSSGESHDLKKSLDLWNTSIHLLGIKKDFLGKRS